MSNNLNTPDDAKDADNLKKLDDSSSQEASKQIEQNEEEPIVEGIRQDDGSILFEFEIESANSGVRLDKFIASNLPDYSRSQIQDWIKEGQVKVNDKQKKQTYKLEQEDIVLVQATELDEHIEWVAEDIPIDVIYEDDAVLVINKPAGLVVHPGAGNHSGTLLNAVLHYAPETQKLARAGIVHRLDKDTSGIMVVAKQEQARLRLSEQLADRSLSRQYVALVVGNLISGGTVDERMNRDKHDRRKMRVVPDHQVGREAITHYRVAERYRRHTLVNVKLETGRTHQIRVHMTHAGFPLVGDPVYGKRLVLPKQCTEELEQVLRSFKRQALHAEKLSFVHPVTDEVMSFECPLAKDMVDLCDMLAEDSRLND